MGGVMEVPYRPRRGPSWPRSWPVVTRRDPSDPVRPSDPVGSRRTRVGPRRTPSDPSRISKHIVNEVNSPSGPSDPSDAVGPRRGLHRTPL